MFFLYPIPFNLLLGGIMPRPMLTDLAIFQEWLVQSYSISRKSASVYTSKVRKVLASLIDINETSLSHFANQPDNFKSRDLFITSWNRFQEYMLEENKVELPEMKRIKQSKTTRKIEICRPLLELANYLKTITKMTYTKMLELKWENVSPATGSTWEIIDPKDYGTIYRVPSELFRNVCNWMFGDEHINESLPIFANAPGVRAKISRSQLSHSLKDFIPLYEKQKKEPVRNPYKVEPNSSLPQDLEISIDDNSDLPDFVAEYEMFDPDKI